MAIIQNNNIVTSSMASLNSTVKDSDSLVGNYLKATKSFHPGDLILLESPALVGPNHLPDSVCLECLVVTNDKCTGCPAALCTNCTNQELKIHSTLECKMLSKLSEVFYPGILPLRLTLEFLTRSLTWEKLQGLQDHVEDNIDKPEWEVMHNEVRKMLLQNSTLFENQTKMSHFQLGGAFCNAVP